MSSNQPGQVNVPIDPSWVARCFKCGTDVSPRGPWVQRTTNNRFALRGTCPNHEEEVGVYRFLPTLDVPNDE